MPVRVFNALNLSGKCPVTIKDGRSLLKTINFKKYNSDSEIKRGNQILSCKDIWFRYEKKSKDILKNCRLSLNEGELYALLGENGSGKSTLLNVINGSLKPYRGRINCQKRIAYLPQNPKNVFVKDSLKADFELVNNSYKELIEEFELSDYLNTHPYDLSGGELQRAAICKILLTEPDILLLDEPTKGLDTYAKNKLGAFLKKLTDKGISVLLVTHDVEFAAVFADRCGLLFDGEITSENECRKFFLNNTFYTTSAAKMSRGIIKNAVTTEDIIRSIDG